MFARYYKTTIWPLSNCFVVLYLIKCINVWLNPLMTSPMTLIWQIFNMFVFIWSWKSSLGNSGKVEVYFCLLFGKYLENIRRLFNSWLACRHLSTFGSNNSGWSTRTEIDPCQKSWFVSWSVSAKNLDMLRSNPDDVPNHEILDQEFVDATVHSKKKVLKSKTGSSAFFLADEELSNKQMILLDSSSIISSNLSSHQLNVNYETMPISPFQRFFSNYLKRNFAS